MIRDLADYVAQTLVDAGIPTTLDPRNINPPCAIVSPPRFDVIAQGPGLSRFDFPVQLIAPGPANLDARTALMDLCDTAIQCGLPVMDGRPTVVTVGSQDFPAYELTVTITARPD